MKTIGNFLNTYGKNSSKGVMRAGIYAFLEFIGGIKRAGRVVTKEEMEQFDIHHEEYWNQKREYCDDLQTFAASLTSKPPLTVKMYVSAVKEYFGHNGVKFDTYDLKAIKKKMPKGRARTEEADMTKEVVQKLLEYTDVRGRALFLILISTGMRIGESLQLTFRDVEDYGGVKNGLINIRGQYTKTGEPRYVFLNKEAANALEAYLKVRSRYLSAMINRNGRAKTKRTMDDPRIFPFSDTGAFEIFSNALIKAGLSNFSGGVHRKTFRIHQFRKYFRSQLALGCPIDIVEALMGHNGYLSQSYRRYTKEQVYEHFKKNEHLLYIAGGQDAKHLESEYLTKLEAYNQENKKLKIEIEHLKLENIPENAYVDMLDDDAFVKKLFNKITAMQNGE